MRTPSVLILGSTGQLGAELTRACGANSAWRVSALSHREIEITDPVAVKEAVNRLRPGTVINCTAFNWVDAAEEDPRPAFAVNAAAVASLARICRQTDCLLLHFSTDYVFDGKKDHPYSEEDPPAPLNLYGLSKLAGEQAIRLQGTRHCIIRTCGLYGCSRSPKAKSNFVETILSRAQAGDPLRVRSDLVCTPTAAADLAKTVCQLLEREATGTFHVTNSNQCSWHEFAGEILRLRGIEVPVAAVSAPPTEGVTAARPRYAVLDTAKLVSLGLRPPASWREALARYLRDRSHEPTVSR